MASASSIQCIVGCMTVARTSAADVVRAAEDCRLRGMARSLQYFLSTSDDTCTSSNCRQLLSALSNDSLDRILRSPGVCEIVRTTGSLALLESILIAEAQRCGGSTIAHGRRWGALGDVWLDRTAPPDVEGLDTHGEHLVSPRLRCGTPIDLSLPPMVGRPSAGLSSPRTPTRTTLTNVLAALDDASQVLECEHPDGHAVFARLTSTIVIRTEATRPLETWGASSGLALGRTVLVNPDVAASPFALGELLLHEAVHALLDSLELEQPLVRPFHTTATRTMASPWTGNSLAVHAFIHAAVVWAVLHEYWSNVAAGSRARGEAAPRISYIRDGFARLDPDRILRGFEEIVTRDAYALVRRAREAALS